MGGLFSTLDACQGACTNGPTTPGDFIEEEMKRQKRIKNKERKRKMDIMGTAMHFAIDDIRHLVGIQSDHEEHAEDDGEYTSMSRTVRKQRGVKRSDSDKSNFSRVGDDSNFPGSSRGEKLL